MIGKSKYNGVQTHGNEHPSIEHEPSLGQILVLENVEQYCDDQLECLLTVLGLLRKGSRQTKIARLKTLFTESPRYEDLTCVQLRDLGQRFTTSTKRGDGKADLVEVLKQGGRDVRLHVQIYLLPRNF